MQLVNCSNLLEGCADWRSIVILRIVRTSEHLLSPHMLEPFCVESVTVIIFSFRFYSSSGTFQKYRFRFSSDQNSGSDTIFGSGSVRHPGSDNSIITYTHKKKRGKESNSTELLDHVKKLALHNQFIAVDSDKGKQFMATVREGMAGQHTHQKKHPLLVALPWKLLQASFSHKLLENMMEISMSQ